ncbi:adenylate kinase, putative [Entamoeba invadens IP1]|uniref:Adenylate kinase, putative n=1 Tax=Entamoeba invadens IP1 TaxID=370355 RepID=A0A0A1TV74_ENTIV|nr:adenylate kinase, putative [Entamoeba invadens IP1]ELP84244.1 adenylate kinase, putative [Entamoeba invadens IP1]|eukprot:XP_004183590.1 adenylate kinase, putative [Entamoeba invadens IP1]
MAKVFLLMMGGPGAGKGTQCDNVVKYLHSSVHISTGDILRAEIKAESEIGLKVKSIIANGQLVSSEIIAEMLDKFIKENTKEVIVFDGYPRTLDQLDHLTEQAKLYNAKLIVVNLEIPDNVMTERILSRGKTSGRADDNADAAKKRLEVYHEQSDSIIKAVKERKVPYYGIENLGTIREVFEDITSVFKKIDLH